MPQSFRQYYIYLLSNRQYGVIYIGMTNSIERRIFEHKSKLVKGFSYKYNLDKLVYYETFQYVNDAIKREKQIKNWRRDWKIALIEKENLNWLDLSKDWNFDEYKKRS